MASSVHEKSKPKLKMTGRLAGKRCIVTGAAQGIARAATLAFLREGAEVMAVDISAEKLGTLQPAQGLSTRVMDVTDRAAVLALAQDYQGVNVLFNCVGYVHDSNLMDTTIEEWDKSFDVNVKSMFHFVQAFIPQMQAGGGGSVINMASVVGNVVGLRDRGVYGATKGAVVGLTKQIATEHIREGIRANAVCPGPVETEAFEQRAAAAEDSVDTEVRRKVLDRLMGRLPSAKDLSGMLVYLASDESWNHTGAIFLCDGGYSLVG